MASSGDPHIARQTVGGSLYSIAASVVTISLGFLRAVLMARLLQPEHFGVTTLALFYLNLATQVRTFGIDGALIHHKETDDDTIATYFTISLGQIAVTVILILAIVPFLGLLHPDMPQLSTVLLAYAGISVLKGFNAVQTTILSKDMAFRQLALTDVISSATMTLVGPALALMGFGVWSIVAELGSGMLSRAVSVWLLYRPWRPRMAWDPSLARWFLNYGSKIWVSSNVAFLLDRFDDWWVGTFLGSNPLGYYSRAYEFARYPRRAIANPIVSVFLPAFARLQDDRARLARAFFRPARLMVRAGALFSVLFISTAPEFIRIFLGEQWIPMQLTFQLMIIYTLLDPLLTVASNLLAGTGHPGPIARARIVQALVFIPAVLALGTRLGIEGVAIAADLMALAGAILLFRKTSLVVDYSQRTLWFWPMVGVALSLTLIYFSTPLWAALPTWGSAAAKIALVSATYLGLLWLAEKKQLLSGWNMLWGVLRSMRGG